MPQHPTGAGENARMARRSPRPPIRSAARPVATRPSAAADARRPTTVDEVLAQAYQFHQAGQLMPAEHLYRAVLSQVPEHPGALHLLGVLAFQQGEAARAAALFEKALVRMPQDATLLFNHGNALLRLQRWDEALARYDASLALQPAHAPAWLNRGNALSEGGRAAEALDSFDKALALQPGYVQALISRGNALRTLHRLDEALQSQDRALALAPGEPDAWLNRGLVLEDLRQLPQALESFERALAARPNHRDTLLARGVVLQKLGRHAQALESYDRAIALGRRDADALAARGAALQALDQPQDTLASYDAALAQDPTHALALSLRLHTKLTLCDWGGLDATFADLAATVARGQSFDPFVSLSTPLTGPELLQCARTFAHTHEPAAPWPAPATRKAEGARPLRIGYCSADFHEHATAYLMARLFEVHDRARVQVVGVSFGPTVAGSAMRQRLEQAFDTFVDVRELSDDDAARRVRELELDIAVDLKGYTTDSRPGLFARRLAPIQAQYLGFPGTLGADFIDYVIADEVLIGPDDRAHYAEKVVTLPGSYQVNDDHRGIAAHTPTREEAGLPAEGFVYACFNNSYKITPEVFDVWMRLLHQTPASVLWLLTPDAVAMDNLRREAQARGVEAQRLVFAPQQPLAEHLARHRLADLFLDTRWYNAHTTASDALWAGLPLLTLRGHTFASRVGASLLHAVGLPELVTQTLADYEALALALAQDPARLATLRARLAAQRASSALFDTARFARHIESAYEAMWQRQVGGHPPAHIRVEPIV